MRTNALVLGTRPATPLEFHLAVLENEVVELDDLVTLQTFRPDNGQPVRFYGVVEETSTIAEGLSFATDTIDAGMGLMPSTVAYTARVRVLRTVPESFFPPMPGDSVSVCRAAEGDQKLIEEALFVDGMKKRLPAGVLRNGAPLYLNFDYINGAKGGHINISGVAGVAAKTSCGLFLLKGIFETDVLGEHRVNSRAVLFNVKGEDLFFIDKANANLSEDDRKLYTALGLEATPFRSVALRAAPKNVEGTILPDLEQRSEGAVPYLWTMRAFCRDGLLPFAFSDEDLERGNLGYLVSGVVAQLEEMAADRNNGGSRDATAQQSSALFVPEGYPHRKETRTAVATWAELCSFLQCKLLGDPDTDWTLGNTQSTCLAFLRRMRGMEEDLARIVRGNLSAADAKKYTFDPVLETDKQISVVDINKLTGRAQKFVVGVVLHRIFKHKESTGRNPTYFIFLDELNKYAPREGRSPIRQLLIDIAERGRSLGVILIGAQQSASRVAEQVVSQASVRIAGRLDGAEAAKADYAFLHSTARERASLITAGSLFVSQPEVPSAMLVRLPMPACATRKDEVIEPVETQMRHANRFAR